MKNIYKTVFLLILNSAFSIHNSFSQTAPGIEWQNTIGGTSIDDLCCVQQTLDSGYIIGGTSWSNISGDKTENSNGLRDYWIVKTNSSGNIQWQNTIGGSHTEDLHVIQQTSDGGYILAGNSQSNISGDKTENSNGAGDFWIIKTDMSGNIQWQNTIGGNDWDNIYSVQQTMDGGYILGGASASNISGDKTENSNGYYDYWIVKTDSIGTIQWQNTIGGNSYDHLTSLKQTSDGGYILGGNSNSSVSGDKVEDTIGGSDYWILKTDGSGNIQWQNTIGGSLDDFFNSILQTSDGYVLCGLSYSNISGDKTENNTDITLNTPDYWIVKIDTIGNIQWQNTIGGDLDDRPYSIELTSDGGYICGGASTSGISGDKTESSYGGLDFWIIKTDGTGNIKWQKTIGGSHNDALFSVQQTFDSGYILGGWSYSNISGDKTENNWDPSQNSSDYWIVKLFPDTITSIFNIQHSIFNIQISPNPLITQSKLTFKNPNKEKFVFALYDITGRIVETHNNASLHENEIILTKGSKPAGVYLFNLVHEKTGERWNGKIVISN